ncbi:MAG: hypothetical protein ACYTDW_16720 [Planctomycetota bacterium]|jgi:hypothetical protein
MESQGILFAEPSIAETGVWCSLSEDIDPAQWASLCRFIGTRSTREFDIIVKMVIGRENSAAVSAEKAKDVRMPLVSIGPSGIGGEYQWEWFG